MTSRRRRHRGVLAGLGMLGLCLVLVLTGAGCGSSGSSSEPSDAVKRFFDAASAGDGKTACALLTGEAKRRVATGTDCEQGLRQLGPVLAAQLKGLKVDKAQVEGDRATVAVRTPLRSTTVELEKVGGKWVISSLREGGGGGGSSAGP